MEFMLSSVVFQILCWQSSIVCYSHHTPPPHRPDSFFLFFFLAIFNYLLPTRPDGVINAKEEDHVLGWVDVHHLAKKSTTSSVFWCCFVFNYLFIVYMFLFFCPSPSKKIKNILCILVLLCFELFVHCFYVYVFQFKFIFNFYRN